MGVQVNEVEEPTEHLLKALKAEKEELEASLSKEKMQELKLKQELTDAESRNADLYKALPSSSLHISHILRCYFAYALEIIVRHLLMKIVLFLL